ncbi:MAG: hypothetical protein LQ339_007455 [Xanthoria mediterranea]|nr:MAG: hypothetical protein LQ339_007455 [Xanthoria mediterranea]
MSIRIQLLDARSVYTNLDFIRGKAILSLTRPEDITAINVKLEGESKSRLEGEPPDPFGFGGIRRRREEIATETEVHKVLYRAVTVFPATNLQSAKPDGVYTFQPGQHDFPFGFKFPFNNTCINHQPAVVNIGGLQMQAPGSRDRHVRKTLPPTLHAFQDQAIIRYYIKATVVRPAFYKENYRTEYLFPFLPIEPPRPAPNRMESYARRQHQFAPVGHPSAPAKSSINPPSIFRKGSQLAAGSNASTTPSTAPLQVCSVCIDARLPDPAIITCNEPLPLRIIITKVNDSPASIYLQLLQIELVANTVVRAHHLARENLTSTVLTSKSNMRVRLSEIDKIMEIDKGWWKDIPLPNTVAPSFDTCNISRTYFVLVKVGLTHGLGDQTFPELTVHTLKMPVSVYSGIPPPPELLQAMAANHRPLVAPQAIPPTSPPKVSAYPPPAAPPPDVAHPIILNQHPLTPIATGQTHPEEPYEDEAPPTYQEAIADGIGPVEGARRDYQHREGAGPGIG